MGLGMSSGQESGLDDKALRRVKNNEFLKKFKIWVFRVI